MASLIPNEKKKWKVSEDTSKQGLTDSISFFRESKTMTWFHFALAVSDLSTDDKTLRPLWNIPIYKH